MNRCLKDTKNEKTSITYFFKGYKSISGIPAGLTQSSDVFDIFEKHVANEMYTITKLRAR